MSPGLPKRLGDRYRVEAEIGRGGMGLVVAAFDERLGRTVALKLLDPERSAATQQRHRFLREARAAAMLESEHVVRVHDAGVFDDAGAYLAMERLEGKDLKQALRERGRFSPAEAVEVLVQACRAVAVAHASGVIHRDLKPSNLFLAHAPEGTRVKVLDFGISKIATDDDTQGTLTDTGSALGSPRYMSPEQVRDAKRVGPASDIWALGVILYELLAGTVPFVADSAPGTFAQIVADAPRPLRELRADVPPALEAICMRCLEKRVEDRYRDAASLARALAAFASNTEVTDDREISAMETTLDPIAPARSIDPIVLPTALPRSIALASMAAAVFVAVMPYATSSQMVHASAARAPLKVEEPAPPAPEPPSHVVVSPPSAPRAAAAAPTHAPVSSTLEPSAKSCDPPFVIDPATMTRRVKPGC